MRRSFPGECVRLIAVLAPFAILGACPGQASAQRLPPEKPLAEALQGDAKEAYHAAATLLAANNYGGAMAKYRQAYELSKDPRLLFDIAICQKSLHQYAGMKGSLAQYELEEGPRISPDDKAAVDAALAAIDKLVGVIALTVNEGGATVSVDGEAAGVTPLAQPLTLDVGLHKIVIAKSGFDSVEKTADVAGGSDEKVELTLAAHPTTGRLVVVTDALSTVVIDGTVVGNGRFDGHLTPGAHAVRVTESGKQPYETRVTLREGEANTVDVVLSSQSRSPWPWIAGGAGAVVLAGAAVGGYFRLKPSNTITDVPGGAFGSVALKSRR